MMIYTHIRRRRQEKRAMLFCFALAVVFISSLLFSIRSSGPLILGSEMNTDGRVEYLCLFGDCNRISLY